MEDTVNKRPVSVVIIAKNEAHIIGQTIKSLHEFTDDIVIADTGSTDDTILIAAKLGCQVHQLSWEGFGPTKNKALALAKYDWIFFLDADEAIDAELLNFLLHFPVNEQQVAYKIRFKNFFGGTQIRHGEWAHECKLKLFHRTYGRWNDTTVHETVVTGPEVTIKIAKGFVLHRLMKDLVEYAAKMNRYAELVANKYYQQGKTAGLFKLYIYPAWQFVSNYIFRLAFLDGRLGFITSYFSSYYAFLKYHRLKELTMDAKKDR